MAAKDFAFVCVCVCVTMHTIYTNITDVIIVKNHQLLLLALVKDILEYKTW